jgi:hypothetical protein
VLDPAPAPEAHRGGALDGARPGPASADGRRPSPQPVRSPTRTPAPSNSCSIRRAASTSWR